MPECPRCHQPVQAQAVVCPFCRTTLKAHGHPGIPLHRATGEEPLCVTCAYHEDDTCNFPQRPHALECTLYTDQTKPLAAPSRSIYSEKFLSKPWLKRHMALLVLVGLVLLSLLLALLR